MQNVVVFGYGRYYLNNEKDIQKKYNVMGIVDNDSEKTGLSHNGITIAKPDSIDGFTYDKILVTVTYGRSKIIRQLIDELNIPVEKIALWFEEGSLGADKYETKLKVDELSNPYSMFKVKADGREEVIFILEETGEYMCFEEWFCRNEYRVDTLKEMDVIDIGMNVGMATLYYASFKNVNNVHGFEPFKSTYDKAVRNIQMNDPIRDKIYTYNIALSDHDGEEQYDYDVEYPGGMSLLRTKADDDSPNKSVIKVCEASGRLKPILDDSELNNRYILMKIDCEGSEYAILNNLASEDLIRKPDYYIVETHFGRHFEAVSILRDNGYVVFSKAGKDLGVIYAVREDIR